MAEQVDSSKSMAARPYAIETALLSNCPLHYLSVVTKYFLPVDLVNDTNIQKIVESGVFEGYAKAEEHKKKYSEIVVGCVAEGLSIPDFLNSSSNAQYVSSDKETVKVMCNEFTENPDLPYTEEHKKARFKTEDSANGRLNQTNIKYTDDYLAFKVMHDPQCMDACLSGCDIRTECFNDKEANDTIAVGFKSWPRVAIPWMVRPRPSGWPSSELKASVVHGGYHVAPVKEDKKEEGGLWEYVFYTADRQLAHSLSRDQRQVFVLLCLIKMFHFETPDVLTYEHLRTVFFWTLEKVPSDQFHENNTGKMLLLLLNELSLSLASGRLEHYYIPGTNMFETVSLDHRKTLCKKIKWVSSNVVEVIIDLNQRLEFPGVGFRLDLQSCFSDHITALKDNPEDELTFYNALISGCFKLIALYLSKMEKLCKGKPNDEQIGQINLFMNICMQALWDIKCYSEETEDFPSDLHAAIYTLGYFSDKARIIARVILHLSNKAGVDKDGTVGCIDDIVHYCKAKQILQRAANLLEIRQSVVESHESDIKTESSQLYVKKSVKQC